MTTSFMYRLILSGFFCLPLTVAAEATAPVMRMAEPISIGSILQMLFGLVLVLVVIFGLGWLLRRVSVLPGQHPKLKIVASLALSNRERVVLVQVGEEQVLVGVAQGQVSLIKSFDEPVIEPVVRSSSEFSKRLQQALKKGRAS
ncbi:flagellar biosynthetic protein FliO [Nitrincola sp. MINF-07-Sa-05]|uniref:flagellar biosynthetic protein FliO n=1 Tax=Nitrincola salilacus TaxID=3400273 RepID=UPI0039180C1D